MRLSPLCRALMWPLGRGAQRCFCHWRWDFLDFATGPALRVTPKTLRVPYGFLGGVALKNLNVLANSILSTPETPNVGNGFAGLTWKNSNVSAGVYGFTGKIPQIPLPP